MHDANYRKHALLRDLLLDYPYDKGPNHPPIPEGIPPEEEDAWIDDWYVHNGGPLPMEGGYANAQDGMPNASLSPSSLPAVEDMRALQEYLRRIMPPGGQVAPVPEDPEQPPTRAMAMARLLRGG